MRIFYYIAVFQNNGTPAGSKSRIPQVIANTLGFGQKHDANVDIPLGTINVMKLRSGLMIFSNILKFNLHTLCLNLQDTQKKEKELAAWQADLNKRERASLLCTL